MKNKPILDQRLFAALALGTLLYSCQPQIDLALDQTEQVRAVAQGNYVPGEVLIKFKRGTDQAKVLQVLGKAKASKVEEILTKMMSKAGDGQGITHATTSLDVMAAISELKAMPEVEYAEPNYIYTTDATSNDPYFTSGQLWGMSATNINSSQAATAWAAGHTGNIGTTDEVIIGIIDEGWMHTHADLAGNGWVNPFEIAGNGQDDDRNGYIDDVTGWDFADNNASTYDDISDDHGTHVAGTIGGKGGNGLGVAGVCWTVKMIGLKFMGSSGGTTANAIKALDYLTDLKTRHGLNIVASNNSWGGGGASSLLQAAIERAAAANILFVAAAGNGGSDGVGDDNDVVANYPSSYPNANVISVAAITVAGVRSSFSNFGATQVDIGAPGSGIWSTVPGSGNASNYASYNGTSMATPYVTGAVALYASTHPGLTAAQLKAAILSTANTTDLPWASGRRLNVSTF